MAFKLHYDLPIELPKNAEQIHKCDDIKTLTYWCAVMCKNWEVFTSPNGSQHWSDPRIEKKSATGWESNEGSCSTWSPLSMHPNGDLICWDLMVYYDMTVGKVGRHYRAYTPEYTILQKCRQMAIVKEAIMIEHLKRVKK